MAGRREDHQREEEERAKRTLQNANLRWPTKPTTYMNLLLVVLIVLLLVVIL